MNKKLIIRVLIAIVVVGAIGAGVGYKMWTKPHPKAEDQKGIAITTVALAKEYGADEKAADAKYLNKVIEVSGTVGETEKNQDGGLMVILQTEDPTAGVQCTMREKTATVNKGQNLTIKGFCSGNGITGVSLTDCVINK
ncbi:hypothetical protein CJD36_004840 [Flavipsychrobacter stenotrophus]|uniref:tRNA_anti-like n=1 Tax=Flavipsychrobacter stenotrophus TaxID=2077091 RepID=A0A2S7T291_9BACT|nr:hypothetical protein [Flavipsychrobacter stenotrophus]PQJ13074.1 hypothetical protein CJD36_004840 [Flavipsychrobacter stenotrophus]